MAVLTLTTDWRNSDYYVGAVKGKIVSRDRASVIVDISHQIDPFNVMQAAFILRNCYREYPEGTIHLIGVNTVLSHKRSLLVIEKEKQFFLCSDTGFPGLAFPDKDYKVYRYPVKPGEGNTFASLDIFVTVALKIAGGESPASFASLTTDFIDQVPIRPIIDEKLINGSVVYVDSYSNAITNITRELFDRVGGGKPFEIFVQSNHYKVSSISKSYADVPSGELLALFNSGGLLEIAIANGPAAELLNLKYNSVIRIKFSDNIAEDKLLLSGI
jgi:S-adenosylmethionine hydrolase